MFNFIKKIKLFGFILILSSSSFLFGMDTDSSDDDFIRSMSNLFPNDVRVELNRTKANEDREFIDRGVEQVIYDSEEDNCGFYNLGTNHLNYNPSDDEEWTD